MNAVDIIVCLFALQVKHFVIDFLMQTKYQWSNKGKLGHPGGILHATLHGVGTWLVLMPLLPVSAIVVTLLALTDAVIHYFVDWAKVNINRVTGWTPTNSEKFWWLLGADQLIHQLTYLGLLCVALT